MSRFLWVTGSLNHWPSSKSRSPQPSGCPGAFGTSRPAPAEPDVPQIPGQSKVFAYIQWTRRFRTFQPYHSSNQSPRPSQTSNTYIPLHVIEVGSPPDHPQLLHQALAPLTRGAPNRASLFGAPKRRDRSV